MANVPRYVVIRLRTIVTANSGQEAKDFIDEQKIQEAVLKAAQRNDVEWELQPLSSNIVPTEQEMDVKYAVGSEVQNSTETTPGYFKFTAPDGSEWKVTKEALQNWIDQGGNGAEGVAYAKSQFFASMNLNFSDWVRDGFSTIEFDTDGEPISWETGSSQGFSD